MLATVLTDWVPAPEGRLRWLLVSELPAAIFGCHPWAKLSPLHSTEPATHPHSMYPYNLGTTGRQKANKQCKNEQCEESMPWWKAKRLLKPPWQKILSGALYQLHPYSQKQLFWFCLHSELKINMLPIKTMQRLLHILLVSLLPTTALFYLFIYKPLVLSCYNVEQPPCISLPHQFSAHPWLSLLCLNFIFPLLLCNSPP